MRACPVDEKDPGMDAIAPSGQLHGFPPPLLHSRIQAALGDIAGRADLVRPDELPEALYQLTVWDPILLLPIISKAKALVAVPDTASCVCVSFAVE